MSGLNLEELLEVWLHVFGRAHVVLVHFPIGLLVIAAIFELGGMLGRLGRRGSRETWRPNPVIVGFVAVGAVMGGVTAGSGWTYAAYDLGDDTRTLLWQHRWLGIAAASLAIVALGLGIIALTRPQRRTRNLFAILLLTCAGLIGLTGHLGGSLVHGSNHLLEPFAALYASPEPAEQIEPPQIVTNEPDMPAIVFAAHVRPIFEDRCLQCHGPLRQRGRLRLDQAEGLFGSQEREGVVVAGSPETSELVRRITLPADHDDRMPGRGDPLTQEQIATIITWIAQGALLDADSQVAQQPTEVQEPQQEPPVQTETSDELDSWPVLTAQQRTARDTALDRLRDRGAIAKLIASDSDAVEVSFALLDDDVSNADLALLDGLESSLVWLDLAGTGVTDDAIETITSFDQLRRLSLQETALTDAALPKLAELRQLEMLNLHTTSVTDAGIVTLRPLANLKRLYVWQTKVTPTGAANLRAGLPNVDISLGD